MSDMSITPDSVAINYEYPEFFLLRGLVVVILLYFMIIFIQAITTYPIVSKMIYLLLAILVGLFSGRIIGRGLLPVYIGEESTISSLFLYFLHQLSWLGGALLITSSSEYNEIKDFKKIKYNDFLFGILLLSIPTFVSCLVVIFYKISY